jgi:hypothetical protein
LPFILADTDLFITTAVSPDIIDYLKAGGRVILVEPEAAFTVEKTNFRLSSWDGGGPSGTILDSNQGSSCSTSWFVTPSGPTSVRRLPFPKKH